VLEAHSDQLAVTGSAAADTAYRDAAAGQRSFAAAATGLIVSPARRLAISLRVSGISPSGSGWRRRLAAVA
jgi:hypothetical protein